MDVFINLTLGGLATGMLLFLIASGLSLIFGLMGILNFAHGALFMWGGYAGTWIYARTGSFGLAILGGILTGIILGWTVERLTIRPVYGNHVAQILITMGVMLVLSELVKVVWGPNIIATPVPPALYGSWEIRGVVIIKYRVFTIFLGLLVALGVHLLLTRTRVGMMVRAGVQNAEMVQALGINIRLVFSLVFTFGAALAALGGVIMGPAVGQVNPGMGLDNQMLAFIVVVIGGMGSFIGSALGSILVGLAGAYTAWFVPEASLAVNVLLMAAVLLLKPRGLFGARG